jgi:hypothetical protein
MAKRPPSDTPAPTPAPGPKVVIRKTTDPSATPDPYSLISINGLTHAWPPAYNTGIMQAWYSDPVVLSHGTIGMFPGPKELELAAEISKLRDQLLEQTNAAIAAQKKTGQAQTELAEAQKSQDELRAKEQLAFVLNRIHPEARPIILARPELQRKFLEHTTCEAYVMSIDIRRSTDLMLKSRRPELFAKFIASLCAGLRDIVLAHNGVFDKFTGDGVLAFFRIFTLAKTLGILSLLPLTPHIPYFRVTTSPIVTASYQS